MLLEANFRAYINGFSKNLDDIIVYFNYRATISQMWWKRSRASPRVPALLDRGGHGAGPGIAGLPVHAQDRADRDQQG